MQAIATHKTIIETQEGVIRLMLIDDEKMMLDVLVDLFAGRKDVEVFPFSSSEAAMGSLETLQVDIVITDLMMPKFSGMDILKRVRELHPETLVVLVTGYGSMETVLEAVRNGAYNYLTKPFQVQEFELLVRNAINRIHLGRRNRELNEQADELEAERTRLQERVEELECQLTRLGQDKEQERRVPGLFVTEDRAGMLGGRMELEQYRKMDIGKRDQLKRALRDLEQLKTKGTLNDTEYETEKKRLLRAFTPS